MRNAYRKIKKKNVFVISNLSGQTWFDNIKRQKSSWNMNTVMMFSIISISSSVETSLFATVSFYQQCLKMQDLRWKLW